MDRSRVPYRLEIIQHCLTCPVREEGLFCQLGPEALAELNTIRQTSFFPTGAVLFIEGQPPRGLFVLCSGKAKLTISAPQGRSVIVRVAEPGEVLGLGAVVSTTAYEASAETLEPGQVSFLPRDEFLRFLQSYGEVSVRVAQHLSMELRRAYHQVAGIALAPTARTKLASLLFHLASPEAEPASKSVGFQLRWTHEEIGEFIGVSRETVTRLLNDFRRQGLIQIQGTCITLPNPTKLQSIIT